MARLTMCGCAKPLGSDAGRLAKDNKSTAATATAKRLQWGLKIPSLGVRVAHRGDARQPRWTCVDVGWGCACAPIAGAGWTSFPSATHLPLPAHPSPHPCAPPAVRRQVFAGRRRAAGLTGLNVCSIGRGTHAPFRVCPLKPYSWRSSSGRKLI